LPANITFVINQTIAPSTNGTKDDAVRQILKKKQKEAVEEKEDIESFANSIADAMTEKVKEDSPEEKADKDMQEKKKREAAEKEMEEKKREAAEKEMEEKKRKEAQEKAE